MSFNQTNNSILVISLHGYVAAEPELGKPDTGGQVVFVLELAKRFSRLGKKVDLLTRQFEDQPKEDIMNDNLRVWRVPFGGKEFIRKEDMHDHISDFVTNTLSQIRHLGSSYDMVYTHYWDAGVAGQKIAEELETLELSGEYQFQGDIVIGNPQRPIEEIPFQFDLNIE